MALIVQKYGGSSVADPDRIKAVCDRVKRTADRGHQVLVVVSAMGKTTDGLIKLAEAVSTSFNSGVPNLPSSQRDLDLLLASGEQVSIALLSMALQAVGQPSIALTGAQVRIVTEPYHTRARILYVETDYLRQCLNESKVIVVAGFQGVALDEVTGKVTAEITTLGRGGSDTSAVAIAAALKADLCEIYTDVPGILTTDPRIVPKAQMLAEITCDEMLELASMGAKVLHPRAVEIARNFGVRLAVRSSWLDDPGTIVVSSVPSSGNPMTLEVNRFVDGISIDRDQVKIALLQVPDRPGIAAQLFNALAERGVNVDLIVQAIQEDDSNDIAFTIPRDELDLAELVTRSLDLGAKLVVVDSQVAKVSITGVGIVGRPGVAAQMFAALADAEINIQMISTSEIKVSCAIAAADGEKAIAALQNAFAVPVVESAEYRNPATAQVENTAWKMQPMDSPVCGVALDRARARLAVRRVPDRPGVAAQLFQHLASYGICVDLIVQSQSDAEVNDIAFTVPIADMQKAEASLRQIATAMGCGEVVSDGEIAKVSIVGAGMVQQSGVAARMFTALANANINIEMIATSEIKVSCVVRQSVAEVALKEIHTAFHLDGDRTVVVAGQPAS